MTRYYFISWSVKQEGHTRIQAENEKEAIVNFHALKPDVYIDKIEMKEIEY